MIQQTITYGGVTLPYSKLDCTKKIRWSSDGMTVEGTDYSFHAMGLINSGNSGDVSSDLGQMVQTYNTPRLRFTVVWYNTISTETNVVFDFTADPTDTAHSGTDTAPEIDEDWGPKPINFTYRDFVGGRTVWYEFSVTAFSKECFDGSQPYTVSNQNPILSITQKWQFSIDQNGMTTQTCSGQLVISSQAENGAAPVSADAFRDSVAPEIPDGFQRVSQNYTQSEDGRTLDYSIVDREKYYLYPQYITDGHVDFSTSVKLWEVGMVHYSLTGSLSSTAQQDKSVLVSALAALIAKYFPPNTKAQPVFWENRNVSTSVYDNKIDFNISARIGAALPASPTAYATGSAIAGLNALTTLIIQSPESAVSGWDIGSYGGDANGDSGVSAAPQTPYDACSTQTDDSGGSSDTPSSSGDSPGNSSGGDAPSPQPPGDNIYGQSGTGASTEQMALPYLECRETFTYNVDNGIIVYPSKDPSTPPFIQQAHNPVVRVTQQGYRRRLGFTSADAPIVPDPIYSEELGNGNIIYTLVEPAMPEIWADGSANLYAVRWQFIMVVSANVQSVSDIGPQLPANPMRPDGSTGTSSDGNLASYDGWSDDDDDTGGVEPTN